MVSESPHPPRRSGERRLPHAAPSHSVRAAPPRRVHLTRPRLADPYQRPAQPGLHPDRRLQGPGGVGVVPLTRGGPMQVATRRVHTGRVINLDIDGVRFPDGSTGELEMIRHPGASAVVPVLSEPTGPDPTLLLLKQYRYATGGTLWEIPAGRLNPQEDPADCARRELREEAGVTAGRLERLTTIWTTPGFTNEKIHLFWAAELTTVGAAGEADGAL